MDGTQILTLVAFGIILLVALFILSRVLKLTSTLIKVGCIIVFALVAIVFIALWALGS